MSDEIKVGDLVWQVDCHCGTPRATALVGIPWKVMAIRIADIICSGCRMEMDRMLVACSDDGVACPVSWLRKINPPAQESERETVVPWDECGWQPEKVHA